MTVLRTPLHSSPFAGPESKQFFLFLYDKVMNPLWGVFIAGPPLLTHDSVPRSTTAVMTSPSIPIFDLAEQKFAWTERRQSLLARNIANVATPRFQSRDAKPFAETLKGMQTQAPVQTQPGHLSGSRPSFERDRSTTVHARAPDGNDVVLDEQLTKVANTETQQSVATAIYKKYMAMFSIALGRS